jgi:site-specific recombinase XerD
MKSSFAVLLESFFTQRLMKQLFASPHTIKSYRDTFHLLLEFAHQRLKLQPSDLDFKDIDTPLIVDFLDEMEKSRSISARTRNVRLAAIRSFFRYAAFEMPYPATKKVGHSLS